MVIQSPIFAHVSVNHSGAPYSLDNSLVEADPTLSADGRSGSCELIVRNDQGQYDWLFVGGDPITISIYKTGQAPTNVFNGTLQHVRPVKEYGGLHNKFLRMTAIDGTGILQARLANTSYQTFQATAPGFTVDYIAKDLVTNPANLLLYQAGISTSTLGITVNNVASILIYVKNIVFSQQSVFNCLNQLAQYSLSNFYVDASLDLHFFQVQSITSAQVLDDTLLSTLDIDDDVTDTKNAMTVNGGTVDAVDDSQTDFSGGSTSTFGQYLAVQFTAGNFSLDVINLWLQKLQSSPLVPVNDLNGEIRTDNSGSPSVGGTLLTFNVKQTSVSVQAPTTSTPTPISTSGLLQPGNKYWIILYKSGQDANNCYLWYYAKGTSGSRPYATSPDGTTWTVFNAGSAFAFQELVAGGILSVITDPTSLTKYGFPRETSIQNQGLPNQAAAGSLGSALLGVGTTNWGMAKKKRFVRITAFPPDIVINPGENVQVIDADLGVNDYYTCLQATYVIKGYECLEVNYQMQRFLY